jgi:hypothetical protein
MNTKQAEARMNRAIEEWADELLREVQDAADAAEDEPELVQPGGS